MPSLCPLLFFILVVLCSACRVGYEALPPDCGDVVCESGYECLAGTCLDTNECGQGLDDCDPLVDCINLPGTFACGDCPSGYADLNNDGTVCQDIDECQQGLHDCDENADCLNTDGTFECTCEIGYIGDGSTCVPADTVPIFEGWEHVQAIGSRVEAADIVSMQEFGVSEYARVTIRWQAMSLNSGTIEGYRVYRSQAEGEAGELVGETGVRSWTDPAGSQGVAYNQSAGIFYYSVRALVAGVELEPANDELDSQILVVVPPSNMVLVHRWMANQTICTEMGRAIDRSQHYSCVYTGPGHLDGRYDLGTHFLMDRFEAGGAPGNEATVNAPGQMPWLMITPVDAFDAVCGFDSDDARVQIGSDYYPKGLPSRKLHMAAAAWDPEHADGLGVTVADLEAGIAGPGSCNTASLGPYPSGSTETQHCITRYGLQDMVGNVWEWTSDQYQGVLGVDGLDGNLDWSGLDLGAETIFTGNGAYADATHIHLPLGLPMSGPGTIDGVVEAGSIDTRGDVYQIRCDGALRSGMTGGDWLVGASAGRFQYHLRHGPGCIHENIGFRCVAALPGL